MIYKKLRLSRLDEFKPAGEEAQHLRFVDPPQAADGILFPVEADDALRCQVHMRVRVHAAGDGKANRLEFNVAIVALRVAARGNDAAFHGAHAALGVNIRRQ